MNESFFNVDGRTYDPDDVKRVTKHEFCEICQGNVDNVEIKTQDGFEEWKDFEQAEAGDLVRFLNHDGTRFEFYKICEDLNMKVKQLVREMVSDHDGYCPKCRSRLFPADDEYMNLAGVCSSCVTYDSTPDKRYQAAMHQTKEVSHPTLGKFKPLSPEAKAELVNAMRATRNEAKQLVSELLDRRNSNPLMPHSRRRFAVCPECSMRSEPEDWKQTPDGYECPKCGSIVIDVTGHIQQND